MGIKSALYLSTIIIASVNHLQPSAAVGHTLNNLLSAALFMTFASTMSSTILIAYRIYSVSRHSVLKETNKRFNGVVELLIQSAAAYSLVSLLYAVEFVVPLTASNLGTTFPLESYTDVFYSFVAVRTSIFFPYGIVGD